MKIERHFAAASLLLASSALTAPALAHESRVLPASTGSIRVTVGFFVEPAFEDTYNGLDLFLFTFDKRCPSDPTDFYGNPITSAEIKSIKAEALYLDKSAPPTGPLGSQPPTGATILKRLLISEAAPIHGVFGDPGNYHSEFRPTHPGFTPEVPHVATTLQPVSDGSNTKSGGAYGYHVYGEVNTQETEFACLGDTTPTKIPARTAKFDNYWICGTEGAFKDPSNPEVRGRFNCIAPVPVFPGNAKDGYQPNKPFSKKEGEG